MSNARKSSKLFGERIVRGNTFGQTAAGSKPDIEDNLRWIHEARRQADWVIASFHSHEFAHKSVLNAKSRGELSDPADFATAYAHAAIDAGADVFVGHGSHTALGIEIYKDKPIFYSVGTLIMQNETLPFFPSEAYGRFGLGNEAAPGDFIDTRTGNGTKGHVAQAEFWENITTTAILTAASSLRSGFIRSTRVSAARGHSAAVLSSPRAHLRRKSLSA